MADDKSTGKYYWLFRQNILTENEAVTRLDDTIEQEREKQGQFRQKSAHEFSESGPPEKK